MAWYHTAIREDKSMKRVFKIIVIVWAVIAVLFMGAMVYGAWDYVHKIADVEPKEEIECIYVGESYAPEDLFNVYRVKEGCRMEFQVAWEDGTTDGINLSPDASSFTVNEGTGNVNIHIYTFNPGAPEGRDADMTVRVEERGE